MSTSFFQFDETLAQVLLSSIWCLIAAAGSHRLWLNRQRKLSTRKVRVTRDYPPHRR